MMVKICGVTNLSDAEMCGLMGADALGFVHVQGRSRSLPLETISGMCSSLDERMTKVLVCAPQTVQEALDMFERSGTGALQLHSLSPGDIQEVRASGVSVMRVVRPAREEAERYSPSVDALVFEDGVPGTGTSYDYSRIPMDVHRRSIIAGGLSFHTLEQVKALRPYGVDVSSGVERTHGRKDPELVREFVRRCRT